jgi:hypothetical protein
MDGWVEGTYRSMPYRRSEVEAAASERFTLPAGADRR